MRTKAPQIVKDMVRPFRRSSQDSSSSSFTPLSSPARKSEAWSSESSLPGLSRTISSTSVTAMASASAPRNAAAQLKAKRGPSAKGTEGKTAKATPPESSTEESRFLEHQPLHPEEFGALEARLGAALNCLRFQRPGLCHTDVQDVLWNMSQPEPVRRQSIGGNLIANAFTGPVANLISPAVGILRGGQPIALKDVLTEGVPEDCVGVVVHAKWGVADTKSGMVEASRQLMSMEVPAASNHCIAILMVDAQTDRAVIYDPDYSRTTPERLAMDAHCEKEGVNPADLAFETLRENGWTGELLRSVSCSDLLANCLAMPLTGVMAIPRQEPSTSPN